VIKLKANSMEKMSAGKINSLLLRKDSIETATIQNEGSASVEKRADDIMDKVRDQYKDYQETTSIVQKAAELIADYKNPDSIPEEELNFEKTGFDDARLLAFCRIITEAKKQSN
jgi:hypothetical protein